MKKLYFDPRLQFVFGVTLMAIMGVSSIVPALPGIMHGLNLTPVKIGLVISIFTLPGVFLAPAVGVLADRAGRKVVLVPALFLFGLAGFGCFFAHTLEQLLVMRFIQGIGASPLGVLYGTLIGDFFTGRERTHAMGYNATVLAMGTAGFPAVGGVLALLGWNYPFLLPLIAIPLGLFTLGYKGIQEPERTGSLKDYMHDALTQMKTKQVISLFVITLLTFMVLYGPIITYLPILLHNRFGASSATIGTVFLISSGFTGLGASQLGRLSLRFGQRPLLMAAGLLYCVGMVIIPQSPGLWLTVLPVLIYGFGQGLCIPTIMTMLTTIPPMEQRGAFMAANGFLLRVAQTIAPLLMGTLYHLGGLEAVYLFSGVLALGISALGYFGVSNLEMDSEA